jgi:predicted glycoside hydrolase/deacetylase ChbG (UPF0249 family)
MNKLILTADDFGVVPSINEGISTLLGMGLLNSVEVFTNYKDSLKNIKNLVAENSHVNFEIGVHLTITSGKPITQNDDLNPILVEPNGFFKEFTDLGSGAPHKALYDELMAQIEVIKEVPDLKDKLTHLTCHHNSLWFYPKYTEVLEQVLKDTNLPVRNPKAIPKWKNTVYYLKVASSKGSKENEDRMLIKKALIMRNNNSFPNKKLEYKAPSYLNTNAMGTLPIAKIKKEEKEAKILSKKDKIAEILEKSINKKSKAEELLIEIMFHLRKGELGSGHDQYKKEIENLDYSGIDHRAFDSRLIEYEGLCRMKDFLKTELNRSSIALGSWKDSIIRTLEKKIDPSVDFTPAEIWMK